MLLEATENNGSPASAAGRGIAPKGELAEGPTHQVGEQTKLLIRGPIPTTSIHPAQATSLRQLGVPCLQPAWSCHTGVANCLHHCWLEHLRLQGLLDRGVVPPLPQVRLLDLSYTGPPAGPAHLAMPQLQMVRLLDRNISYATTATGPPAGPEHQLCYHCDWSACWTGTFSNATDCDWSTCWTRIFSYATTATGPPAGPEHLAMLPLRLVGLLDRSLSYATTATGPPAGPEPLATPQTATGPPAGPELLAMLPLRLVRLLDLNF